MLDAILRLSAIASALAGAAWLALSLEENAVRAAVRPGSPRARRIAGAAAVVLSLAAEALVDAPAVAFVVWVMLLAAATLAVAALLAYQPRLLALLVRGSRDQRSQ